MLEDFLINPFLAIILITTSCSLLGVFVLWKKLSYFGDALSHSILLGLACSALFEINQILTLVTFASLFALSISFLSQSYHFSKGTMVMILSYFCVALSVIFNDIWLNNFNFTSYIFGDILTAGPQEVRVLMAISALTIFYVVFAFKKILFIKINQDLAKISGIKTEIWNSFFLILLSITIALSVRIVGIFLMTALLILPAAIARIFSISAKQMMALSVIIGISISTTSFKIANDFNLTCGSVIIAGFSIAFFLSLFIKKLCCHEKL